MNTKITLICTHLFFVTFSSSQLFLQCHIKHACSRSQNKQNAKRPTANGFHELQRRHKPRLINSFICTNKLRTHLGFKQELLSSLNKLTGENIFRCTGDMFDKATRDINKQWRRFTDIHVSNSLLHRWLMRVHRGGKLRLFRGGAIA